VVGRKSAYFCPPPPARVARAVAYDVAARYPDALAFGVALGETLVMSTARAVAAMQA
jgi:hypothetical protein